MACLRGQLEVAELLMAKGADVETKDTVRQTHDRAFATGDSRADGNVYGWSRRLHCNLVLSQCCA